MIIDCQIKSSKKHLETIIVGFRQADVLAIHFEYIASSQINVSFVYILLGKYFLLPLGLSTQLQRHINTVQFKAGLSEEKLSLMPCLRTLSNVLF
jgi:hypothetical protein